MRFLFPVVLIGAAQMAAADGFALNNLQKVEVDNSQFAGGTYEHQKERKRIILACTTCDDLTSISVEIGRSTDGTEGRFRSGETTVEKMQNICQQRNPKCRLTRLDLGPAVGWVTQYKLGPIEGSTAVLFRDGDLLTVRTTSDSRNRTGSNMAAALDHIAPQIVGK